jgi:arsenite methyltransferase
MATATTATTSTASTDNATTPKIPLQSCCAPGCCAPKRVANLTQLPSTPDAIRDAVRDNYAQVALTSPTPGAQSSPSLMIGYSAQEVEAVPDGADLGLGCGNPQAIASLSAGEVVLDLGSGAGFDCFLAARQVGPSGAVIGVDMTPEMITKARHNAASIDAQNVTFRLGEIEHLPLPDAAVDVVISNCVINLSPDKPAVYREAFRALKPGGRVAISDVIATQTLPAPLREQLALHLGCVAGAATIDEHRAMLTDAGFEDVHIRVSEGSRALIRSWMPDSGAERFVASAQLEARKPLAL